MERCKYLLDSNICIHLLRGRKEVYEHLSQVEWKNCCISEITVIELLYGAECSKAADENRKEVLSFCADLEVIPISNCTIGAGSVVTRSTPAGCIAVGNPCRVLRRLNCPDTNGIP